MIQQQSDEEFNWIAILPGSKFRAGFACSQENQQKSD